MADIRINALATTAASTASDDFVAVDGTAQGTRKLSAYSPSFGGNLTVTGNINPFTIGPGYTGFAGSIGILGGNGLFIQGKTGTTYDFAVGNNAGSVAFGIPAGTTNVSVAGNLTVSGTGGSTFNAASVASPSSAYQANQAFRIISTTTAEVQQAFLSGGTYGYYIQVGGASTYPLLLQPSGSSVLLGTTTDSGNGKLQLATHSTSAGGIGFGTDTSLYRQGAGVLTGVEGYGLGTGSALAQGLSRSGNNTTLAAASTGTVNIGTGADGTIYAIFAQTTTTLKSNGTTALTLDSSQQAKFSSAVYCNTTTQSSGVAGAKLITKQTSGTNDWTVTLDGNPDGVAGASYGLRILAGTNSSDYSLYIRNQTNTTTLLAVKGSGRVNMGALPTSSTGLSAGDIWNDAGTLKIV